MKVKLPFILFAAFLAFAVFAWAQNKDEEVVRDEYPGTPEPPQVVMDQQGSDTTQEMPSVVPVVQAPEAAPPAPVAFPAAPPAAPAKAVISAPSSKNTISLDIKGMDIVDVLKMLASRASMNVVVGKNVTGRVTLFLKDVDVWDAFEIILLANDMAYENKNGIINVMTQRDYELLYGERYRDKKEAKVIQLKYAKAADLSRSLNQIKTNIGRIVVDEGSNTLALIDTPEKIKEMEDFIGRTDLPLKSQVFNLNYAQADKLSPKIQEVLTKGVGSMRIDERTNKIAITDYPAKIDEIAKIINAFDEKTPQVVIDVQIIEITPSDQFAMGVDWDYWLKHNVHLLGALAAPLPTGVASIANKLSFGVTAANATSSVSNVGEYKAAIDLLRVIGETKILSSPRIMALNNQEAKILVGTKEAYITSTTSLSGTGTVTSQSVNFVDVGIKLYVTPTINRDDFVTMKIRPEVSSSTTTTLTSEDKNTQVPIVTTSETETTIMVKDGSTIIIAGLKKDKRAKAVQKIPVIGDIPIIGHAFRNTKDEVLKSELVIFITPHIVSGEESVEYSSLTNAKEITTVQAKAQAYDKAKAENMPEYGGASFAEAPGNAQVYKKFVSDKIRAVSAVSRISDVSLRGEVEASFVLTANGRLKDEPKVIFSSNPNLNHIALASIKNASPFPPFPVSLDKEEEVFKIRLTYE